MFVAQAPSFAASGDSSFSCSYKIDFNKDKSWRIPTSGEWQGTTKKCLSLYVDNYDNNFSVTVKVGNKNIIVGAYTAQTINISTADEFDISCDNVTVININIDTTYKSEVTNARGVAPLGSNLTPFSIAGSINVGKSNTIIWTVYNKNDGLIYSLCNSNLIVIIDPKTNLAVNAIVVPGGPGTPSGFLARYAGNGKIIMFANFGGANQCCMCVMNADRTFTAWTTIVAGNSARDACYKESSDKVFVTVGGSVMSINMINLAVTSIVPTNLASYIMSHPNGFLYGVTYESPNWVVKKFNEFGGGISTYVGAGSNEYSAQRVAYIPNKNGGGFICLGYDNGIIRVYNDIMVSQFLISAYTDDSGVAISTNEIVYNESNGYIYTFDNRGSGSSMAIFDMMLQSPIAKFSASGIKCACFCPINGFMYWGSTTLGTIYYGK